MVEERLLAEVAEVDPYNSFFLNLFNLPKSASTKNLEKGIYDFYRDVPASGVIWAQDTIDVKFNTLSKFKHAVSKGDPTLEGVKINIRSSLTVGHQDNKPNDHKKQRQSKFQANKQYNNQDGNYRRKDIRHQKDGYDQSYTEKYTEQYSGSKKLNQKYDQYPEDAGKKPCDKPYGKHTHAENIKDSTTHENMLISKDSAVYSKHDKRASNNYQGYEDTYTYDQDRYYYYGYDRTAKYDKDGYHDTYNKRDQYKESSNRQIKDHNYGKDASHNDSQYKDRSKKSPVESKYHDEARVPVKQYNQKYDLNGDANWTKADDYSYYNYYGYDKSYKYNDTDQNYYEDKKKKSANQEAYNGSQYDQNAVEYYSYYKDGHDQGYTQAKDEYNKEPRKHLSRHNYQNDDQYGSYDYQKNLDYYDYNNPKKLKAEDHNPSSHKHSKKVKEYDCTGGSSFVVREVPKANEKPREVHSSVHKLPIVAESGFQKGTEIRHSDNHLKQIAASSLEQYDYRQKHVKSGFQNESYALSGAIQGDLLEASKKVSLLEQLQPEIPKQVSKATKKEVQPDHKYSFYGATANDIAKLYSQENKIKQQKSEAQSKGADLRKISEEDNEELWGRKRFYNTGKVNNKMLFKE